MVLFKPFMRVQMALFRISNGRLMSTMRGLPLLILTTIGHRTAKRRTNPLMYIRDGNNYVVTASNNGLNKHPSWFYNVRASPLVQIEVPSKHLQTSASVATDADRVRLWPQLVALAPFFEEYQKGITRTIPMVILIPR